MYSPFVFFPAFAVASPVTIELLGVSLLIASDSMKRPTGSQPGEIISCVSKGISCP